MDLGQQGHGPDLPKPAVAAADAARPAAPGADWASAAAGEAGPPGAAGARPLDITELRRLDALDAFEVVDSPPEPEFDRVVHLAARMFGAEVALVCLVDEHRLWFKAKAGTDWDGQPRAGSFCSHAVALPGVTVVEDAQAAPWFGGATPLDAACGFYAGAPLVAPGGEQVGMLCVMGRRGRAFPADDRASLADLAAIVSQQLEQRRGALALARLSERNARMDGLMHAVADAGTCEGALAGLLAQLCDDHGAAAGHIWRLAPTDQVLREVSRNPANRVSMDAHFDLARSIGMKPGNSLTADAIVSGKPRAIRFAGVADLHRYPLLASALRLGLRSQVIQPILVSGERFALTLFFDRDRTDLDLVLGDVGSLVDTIRPALYRKMAEERTHLLGAALDHANDAVMLTEAMPHDPSGPRIAYVNLSFCRATGYDAGEVLGQSPCLLLGRNPDPAEQAHLMRVLQGQAPGRAEVEHTRKDGSRYWVEMDVTPIAGGGWQSRWISIQRDVTARRLADQARKERDASNRTLFEQSPMPTLVFDRRTLRFLDVNGAAVRQYGWSRAQFLGMSLPDVQAADEQPAFGTLLATDQGPEIAGRSWTHLRADGSRIQVAVASHALTYAGEDAVMAVLQDVTHVEAAQRAMQDANSRLADLAAQLQARTADLTEVHRLARLGSWRRSLDGADVTWSDEMYELMSLPQDAGVPAMKDVLARIHPDDHPALRLVQNGAPAMRAAHQLDFRVLLPGGGVRHCRLDARPVLDGAGTVTGLYGYCQDITADKQTELALLRSEKLKSIGQLTGGIAHDFNNLLTVVTLNLEEALDTLPAGAPLHDVLRPAMHAAVRGADLTKQLLSYARRATLRPERVRLSDFLRNLRPMLTRTLGKHYDLQLTLGEDGAVFIDPAQLENAVINLVINARDAMPDGGCIQVSTALATVSSAGAQPGGGLDPDVPDDLAPGRYLRVSVTDGGAGIPPDVLPRVFEPFFTTKDLGHGSGLGLSMVYGFAKQSGGQATISSQVGVGTTVRLLLPVLPGGDPAAQALSAPAWQQSGLRALVVDDEPDVLAAAARMLSHLGLHVTSAGDAADAAARLGGQGRFDLLFSDVRLPGPVDGVQLAELARSRAPGISVLLTSGYTDHGAAALDGGPCDLPGGTRFLAKPYTRQALHAALSDLLGRDEERAALAGASAAQARH